MNQSNSAIRLGLSKHYFSILKRNNALVYRFMKMYGKGNFVIGYERYDDYKRRLSIEFTELYFSYETGYAMALEVSKFKIYANRHIATVSLGRLVVSVNPSISSVKKMREIIKKLTRVI